MSKRAARKSGFFLWFSFLAFFHQFYSDFPYFYAFSACFTVCFHLLLRAIKKPSLRTAFYSKLSV